MGWGASRRTTWSLLSDMASAVTPRARNPGIDPVPNVKARTPSNHAAANTNAVCFAISFTFFYFGLLVFGTKIGNFHLKYLEKNSIFSSAKWTHGIIHDHASHGACNVNLCWAAYHVDQSSWSVRARADVARLWCVFVVFLIALCVSKWKNLNEWTSYTYAKTRSVI